MSPDGRQMPQPPAELPGGNGTAPRSGLPRRTGLAAVLLFLAAALGGAWWGLGALERQHREETGESLEFIAGTTRELLRAWLSEETHYLERWARDPQVAEFGRRLLATPRSQAALVGSKAQRELRAYLRERDYRPGGMGFFIIAPDRVSVASMRDANIGTVNLIAEQRPGVLQRAFSGETVFVPPIRPDVPLPGADGELRQEPPTMFVATPIRGADGGVMAVMTLRIDPARDLRRLCKLGRIGMTGETYAFDDEGRLVTESRFREELIEAGLVGEGQHGVLSIRLSDPGADLTKGHRPTHPSAEQPLTRMAADALAGRSGVDLEGYRDYRGARVLGAWAWDPLVGIGIATEVDESEILATYHLYRAIVLVLLAVTVLLAIVLTGFTIWSGERASRAIRQARDEWERVAEERTAELAESESKFRAIFDQTVQLMAVLDRDGNLLEANRAALELAALELDDVLDQPFWDAPWWSHSAELQHSVREAARQAADGEFVRFETTHVAPDGGVRIVDFTLTPVVDENGAVLFLLPMGHDITERQAATEESRKLSRAVEYSPASVVITDRQGSIEYVNPAFTEVTGYAPEEAIGRNPSILNSGQQPAEVYAELWQTISGGASWRGELCNRKKSGELYWESASISPIINDGGGITHFVAVKEDITERRAAQEALAEAEERRRMILESAGEGIFGVDLQGRVTFVNGAAARLLGYEAEELTGQPVHNLIHHSRPDGTPYPVEDCPMRRAYTDGTVHQIDDEALWRKDGTGFAVEYSATPIRKQDQVVGAVVTFGDITARKQAAEELERINFLSDSALDLTHAGYWQIDYDDPDFYTSSERAAAIFGEPAKDDHRYHLVHEWHSRIAAVDPDIAEKTGEHYAAAVEGSIPLYDATYPYRRPTDGRVVWVRAIGSVVRDADGAARHMYGVAQDITEQKQAEAELVAAREAADAANQAKSAFLANMSHEIRTPMSAILGFTEILSRLIREPQQTDYLRSIQTSGKSLLSLINDILDLSKVEAGKLELEYEATNPRTVFEEMQAVFSQKVAEKGLDLLIEIDPDLPPAVVLDETRLRQVLLNVIGNAIKFTDAGHVKLSVRNRYPDDNRSKLDLVFEVEDTGIGIPEDQIDKIFGAFEQRAGQSINDYGGTGLGLAITRRLVEMMNGEISVTSEVGKGSTFHVTLSDLSVASVSDVVDASEEQVNPDAVTFGPATIPVVDDIAANRDVVSGYLAADEGGAEVEATDLPGLVDALREQDSVWQELRQTQTINEIEAFGNAMSDLGQEHTCGALIEWGKTLANQAVMFDLAGMQETLEGFSAVTGELEAAAAR